MPRVNWTLLAAVLVLVVIFQIVERAGQRLRHRRHRHDGRSTSLLAFAVFRRAWGWPLRRRSAVIAPLLAIELIFLGANLAKLHDGGYVPLIIAGVVGTLMTTWVRGTAIVQRQGARRAASRSSTLIGMLKKSQARPRARHRGLPHLRPGRRARRRCCTTSSTTTCCTSATSSSPSPSPPRRGFPTPSGSTIEPLADNFWRVRLTFGYMETPNVPKALALGARATGFSFEMMSTSYFLNRRSFRPSPRAPACRSGRTSSSSRMTKAASDATSFYRLPSNRVLELGQQLVV